MAMRGTVSLAEGAASKEALRKNKLGIFKFNEVVNS